MSRKIVVVDACKKWKCRWIDSVSTLEAAYSLGFEEIYRE